MRKMIKLQHESTMHSEERICLAEDAFSARDYVNMVLGYSMGGMANENAYEAFDFTELRVLSMESGYVLA